MKIKSVFIIGMFSTIAFTSCKDNNEAGRGFELDESVERDLVEVEGDNDENSVAVLIRRNENLSTFAERLEKNQFQQNYGRTAGQGTVTGQKSVTGEGVPKSEESSNMTGDLSSDARITDSTRNDSADAGKNSQISMMEGYTIFAPSNQAYDNLPEGEKDAMLVSNNREENLASINYLMVNRRLPMDELKQQIQNSNGGYTFKTMQGENITARMDGEFIVLKDAKGNEARVVETDEKASDGIIYVVDGILMPGDLSRNEAVQRDIQR